MPVLENGPHPLDLEFQVEPQFDYLSEEYRVLYEQSDATAFQAPLWMHSLNQKLAPKVAAKPYTITGRRVTDGVLKLLMPFVVQKASGIRMLLPADFGVCDYNAIVAENAVLEDVSRSPRQLAQIADLIRKTDLLMLRKLRSDGFDVSRIFPKCVSSVADHAAYRCDFGSDFETWRKSLAKSISNRLPRQLRQVEQQIGAYEHRLVTDEAEIRKAFAFLQHVRHGMFENDLIEDPAYFNFYLDYAIASAASGESGLYVGYINGEPISFLFGLIGGRHFHAVQLGGDRERYGKYSVGNQVYFFSMQDQFTKGQGILDMGIGNTGYKSDFRAVETVMHNVTSAQTLRGAAVSTVYHHAKPLKNMLRRLTPRLH